MPEAIKPRHLSETEMQKVGVVVVNLQGVWLRCRSCGEGWSPDIQTGGKMPPGYWRCPNGCNANLHSVTIHEFKRRAEEGEETPNLTVSIRTDRGNQISLYYSARHDEWRVDVLKPIRSERAVIDWDLLDSGGSKHADNAAEEFLSLAKSH